jgi:hypothetical protein
MTAGEERREHLVEHRVLPEENFAHFRANGINAV